MKHKIAALLVGGLAMGALAGCQLTADPAPTITAEAMVDYPYYETYAELAEQADLVVTGEVISQEQVELDYSVGASADPEPYRVLEVKLTGVVAGDAQPGDTIQVAQYGGIVDGVLHTEAGAYPLEVGQTYGLILKSVADKPALTFSPYQSIYLLHDDGTFRAVGAGNPIAGEVEELLAPFGGDS